MQGDVAELAGLFRCPVTHSPLTARQGSLAPERGSGIEYRVVDGTPILLDPDSSVIDPASDAFTSPVQRIGSKLGRWTRRALRPPNRATVANMKFFVDALSAVESPRVLVVGGGTVGAGSELLYDHPVLKVFAFDIYKSPSTHFVADGHSIPLEDSCFDGVLVQAVLEHVVSPETVVAEIRRVLRPGGLVYSEIPFLQGVHEGAYDFTRYTESGHRWLYREFDELGVGVVSGVGTQLAWALSGFVGALFRSRFAAKSAMAGLSWLRLADRISPPSWNSDYACATYFFGAKADGALTHRHIVDRYTGAQ